MSLEVMVGGLAAVCSIVSFAPQAIKVIRSRRTHDLSPVMYALTVTSFTFWTVYGVMVGMWPLIVANGICLLLSGFIFGMILLPPRQKDAVANTIDPAT